MYLLKEVVKMFIIKILIFLNGMLLFFSFMLFLEKMIKKINSFFINKKIPILSNILNILDSLMR